jgi:hypothetical protein
MDDHRRIAAQIAGGAVGLLIIKVLHPTLTPRQASRAGAPYPSQSKRPGPQAAVSAPEEIG